MPRFNVARPVEDCAVISVLGVKNPAGPVSIGIRNCLGKICLVVEMQVGNYAMLRPLDEEKAWRVCLQDIRYHVLGEQETRR